VRWHCIGSLRTLVPPSPLPALVTLLVALCLFFYPEDGTSRFFLDSGNYPSGYTASQPTTYLFLHINLNFSKKLITSN
jgi:hypothetical protein